MDLVTMVAEKGIASKFEYLTIQMSKKTDIGFPMSVTGILRSGTGTTNDPRIKPKACRHQSLMALNKAVRTEAAHHGQLHISFFQGWQAALSLPRPHLLNVGRPTSPNWRS